MRPSIRLAWLVLLLVVTAHVHADTLQGTVVAIIDGDTVDLLDENLQKWRIRLAGIDAPEKGQPFGNASKQNLARLVFQKVVQVEWTKRDRYGRVVGTILVGGVDANLEQVASGMAWVYLKYLGELPAEDRRRYLEAETAGRIMKIGLWSDIDATPPWDWRRKR